MQDATERFVKEADYLTDSDQAAITALRQMAVSLDDKMNAALMGNWYKIYSDLKAKEVQEQPDEPDEQEQFLKDLGV